ncbi:hypothetical protein BDFB_013234, partial [Asbolus verrucosus]
MFKRIFEVTQTRNKTIYVEHSLGMATSYIYCITRKEEARKRLAALISLAPTAFLKHININFRLLAKISGVIYEMLPILWTQAPTASSLNVLRHFSQIILNNGQFQAFDYDALNYKKYGKAKPPVYNISEINI